MDNFGRADRLDYARLVCGVLGTMMHRAASDGERWIHQKWRSERRALPGSDGESLVVTVTYDDDCKNGHNSFAVTADGRDRRGRDSFGGSCHDEIVRAFPELAPLIPFHNCSADGPLHYVANAVYLAGDRDHYGKRKGEIAGSETAIYFGDNPIGHRFKPDFIKFLQDRAPGGFDSLQIIPLAHDGGGGYKFEPKFTFAGFGTRWHQCPFDNERDAGEFLGALQRCSPRFETIATAWAEGKARDLDAARRVAIWPEATDAELSAEPDVLRAALEARLPALLERFKAAIVGAGLYWSPAEFLESAKADETAD